MGSANLPRGFRYEVTIRVRHGEWERRYVVEGARGAVEFWCRTSPTRGDGTAIDPDRSHYGGFEVHRVVPFDGGNEAPDHGRCSAVSDRACWHDGSSTYASEDLIPRWLMDPENHEAVFRGLVGDYLRTFEKETDHG